MKCKIYCVAGFFLAVSGMSLQADRVMPEPYFGQIAKILADGLPRFHLKHTPINDDLAEQALDLYLDALDFDHSLFMQSDIDEFYLHVQLLDNQLEDGHLAFAYQVFERFKERAVDRANYVHQLLDQGFDYSNEEYFEWKRKDAPWPKGQEEWDELWRLKIKSDLLARTIQKDLDDQEAAEKAAEKASALEDGSVEPVVEAAAVSNAVETVTRKVKVISPEELIRKRFDQFVTVLDGHDGEWVLQMYLNSWTRSYDPHSAYLSPRLSEDFDISMRLSLQGIGALLTTEDGAAKIIRLIPGGPAEQDGRLQAGDKIIAVAQEGAEAEDIMFLPLYKSVRLIRGPKGSKVILSVIPTSDPSGTIVKEIDITREEIKLEERAAKKRIREVPAENGEGTVKLGIIELPDFYRDFSSHGAEPARSCARDVHQLVDELKTEGVQGIIIDLRNNGGGSLPDAVEMTGLFIPDGPVVQVKSNRRIKPLHDPDPELVYNGPLVILVNRQSASASEIMAAALQDYGRAIVVGDSKTHGKGSVQTLLPLNPNLEKLGQLKLTTAGFYRINGDTTQLQGVHPDIVIPSTLDVLEIGEEYLQNVLSMNEIQEARYRVQSDLSGTIVELKSRSNARLEKNDKYDSYQALLARLSQRTKMLELPLKYDQRMALARADRELTNMQREQFGIKEDDEEVEKDDEKKDANDLILTETLHILADLVYLGYTPNPS